MEKAGTQEIDQFRSEGDLNISPRRQAWSEAYIDQDTAALLAEDEKYFLHQSLSTPCLNVLTGCEGPYIIDKQGARILDFHGNWVHQVGFSNPKVVQAITDQLQTLSFCTRRYTSQPAVDLAKKLVSLAPGDLDKVLFAPGGALAMGMALKLARTVTGRHKTISMWDAFHGASLDMISIGGEAIFRQNIGPLLPGSEHAPPPNPSECPWECGKTCSLKCADYIEYMLKKEGDVAAVIAETVRSTPYIPPPEYWQKVRAACDRHGALLILDEIPHALGRTGKMFSVEHYGIVPDMLVIGKGLGGGIFPLAALIARGKYDVAGTRALGHYTHEKNPVACAAALATIGVVEEEGLLEHVTSLGAYAIEQLQGMQKDHAFIGDVRGLGLMLGVEIKHERANDLAEEIMYSALTKGLSFKLTMGNILLLVPALTITRSQMDDALGILSACFQEVAS